MTAAAIVVVGCALWGAEPELKTVSYNQAHRECVESGKPMLVVVGAEWCPACKAMEKEVLPKLQRRGLLRKVILTLVDYDRQPQLGERLTGGGPIPQLLLFRRDGQRWRSGRLIGWQEPAVVERFINRMVPETVTPVAFGNESSPQPQAAARTISDPHVVQAQHSSNRQTDAD